MPQPVGEQAEQRCGKDRREKHPAIGDARLLQREPLGVLEIFNGIGLPEREEHGRVEHMQTEDVPIGHVELQKIAPDDTLGCVATSGTHARPVMPVDPIKGQCRD
jgi:hypothetical protein